MSKRPISLTDQSKDWVAQGPAIIIRDGDYWFTVAKVQREVKYGFKVSVEEAESTARLMASAPTLLQACKSMLNSLEALARQNQVFATSEGYLNTRHKIIKAIIQAEGG